MFRDLYEGFMNARASRKLAKKAKAFRDEKNRIMRAGKARVNNYRYYNDTCEFFNRQSGETMPVDYPETFETIYSSDADKRPEVIETPVWKKTNKRIRNSFFDKYVRVTYRPEGAKRTRAFATEDTVFEARYNTITKRLDHLRQVSEKRNEPSLETIVVETNTQGQLPIVYEPNGNVPALRDEPAFSFIYDPSSDTEVPLRITREQANLLRQLLTTYRVHAHQMGVHTPDAERFTKNMERLESVLYGEIDEKGIHVRLAKEEIDQATRDVFNAYLNASREQKSTPKVPKSPALEDNEALMPYQEKTNTQLIQELEALGIPLTGRSPRIQYGRAAPSGVTTAMLALLAATPARTSLQPPDPVVTTVPNAYDAPLASNERSYSLTTNASALSNAPSRRERIERVQRMYEQEMTVKEMADALGVSRHRIYRDLNVKRL
jgi:hypothetical protein